MGRWTDFWRSVFVPPPPSGERAVTSLDEYIQLINSFYFQNNPYYLSGNTVQQTIKGQPAESIENSLEAYARQALQVNGAVFACMLVRMSLFSAIRFQYQRMNKGRPGDLFSNETLRILERPFQGGTTQDMLAQMIQDADLVGNSYWTLQDDEFVRLRPDWTAIVLEPRFLPSLGQDPAAVQKGAIIGYKRVGYMYQQGGTGADHDPVFLGTHEVAHFAPNPDPLAYYRGMSPMTPIIREIKADGQMMQHKSKFLEQGATPNMIVSFPQEVTYEKFKQFKELMDKATSGGPENAYKTLYLAGGADVEVVGADFKQLDFNAVQGHGETRIAAAFGVPPVIVGLSEGLEAATYSNYSQARRRFADGTMHPLWQNACGSIEHLVKKQSVTDPDSGRETKKTGSGVRLWYDARDIPFLREDRKDAAEIQGEQSTSIRTLVDAGYEPDTCVDAVVNEDFTLLEHSGLFSIQLQPPGTMMGMPGMPTSPNGSGGSSPVQNMPKPMGQPAQGQKPAGTGKPKAPAKPKAASGGGKAKKPAKRAEIVSYDEETGLAWYRYVYDDEVDEDFETPSDFG